MGKQDRIIGRGGGFLEGSPFKLRLDEKDLASSSQGRFHIDGTAGANALQWGKQCHQGR